MIDPAIDFAKYIKQDLQNSDLLNSSNLQNKEEFYVSANPGVNFDATNGYNKNYLIKPEDTFEDVFKVDYTEYIEKNVGCKIKYISVGAERDALIEK